MNAKALKSSRICRLRQVTSMLQASKEKGGRETEGGLRQTLSLLKH